MQSQYFLNLPRPCSWHTVKFHSAESTILAVHEGIMSSMDRVWSQYRVLVLDLPVRSV